MTKSTTYRPFLNKEDSGIDLVGLAQEQHFSLSREVRLGNAWGLAFTSTSSVTADRFTYNSKELLTDLDLGWNDGVYPDLIGSARMYMSEIGRWNAVDPLAELDFDKTSFHYVSNNPINRIDPTGCKDCDNNGSDDGDCFNGGTFEEVTISAKKPTISIGILGYIAKYIDSFDPLGLENHYKYLEKHGNDESWKKVKSSFRDGGNIAAGVTSAPILLIGAAEGVGYLGSARLVGLLRNSIQLQTNWGAGIGDLASQLTWNGGDIRKVNLLSVAGQTFIGGKLSPIINSTTAFVGYTIDNNKLTINFKIENFVEFGANILGNSLSSLFDSGIPQQTAKVAKNLYSGVANFLFGNISNPISESYKENNEKK